jgi:dephospho-CoA kinase
MLKVGITGGIASGKSLICEVFKRLGIHTYNADIAAKRLYDTDNTLKSSIIKIFGKNIYKNEILDRSTLSSIIFEDKEAISEVNKLVHPAVERDFKLWLNKHDKETSYVILEAAILFESGFAHIMDKIINVSAPEEIRISRAISRGNINIDDIRNRIKNQISDEERNRRSDFIIVCNDIEPVLPQILNIHNKLLLIR